MPGESPTQALVVDDNHVIMLHAANILEEAGFEALTAFNANEAIERLEAHGQDIALLFTDVQMPRCQIDGFELARWTAERFPVIGILVASGERTPQEGDLPEGAHFVPKPFSAEIIYERLHQLLPHERKPRPLLEKP